MSRNYVDNPMNRKLGRVGLPVGTAVHSRNSSSGDKSSSSSSGSHRTYVDNSMNRKLDRVGMEHGTAVHSRSDRSLGSPATHQTVVDSHGLGFMTPLSQSSQDTSSSSSYGSHRTYVDNSMNRKLGRVGLEHGTAVHSRSDRSSGSPATHQTVVDSYGLGFMTPLSQSSQDTSSSSSSGIHKTYVDNSMNRRLGRVGLEHGTAVHSSSSSSSGSHRIYVDNRLNRMLGRVGLEHGTAVHSRSSGSPATHQTVVDSHGLGFMTQLSQSSQDTSHSQEQKVYVDNSFNRKHKRVGLPLGSAPVSKKNEVYKDTQLNRELGRVGKTWGSHVASKEKLAALHTHLEEHFDDEIPTELDDLSEDDISCVLEFRHREQAVEQFLEKTANSNWQPHVHTITERLERYKGTVIDFMQLKLMSRIGHGTFGKVYFASLDGEAVAVKKLISKKITKKCLEQFKNEINLFIELKHPNIVSFLGACTVPPNLAIVMEFMDMSLFDAIHMKKVDFSDDSKLEIMRGVTKGIGYLHNKDIAHCDVKTKNILLINVPGMSTTDENEQVLAKITDFGLSKMKSDMTTSTSRPSANIGTPLYSAPEILRGEILTLDGLKQADMYSLGRLLWELALEYIPFEDFNYEQLKRHVGCKGQTPVMPEHLRLNGKLHEYILLCWNMNPNKRPSAIRMAEVACTLTSLFEEGEE